MLCRSRFSCSALLCTLLLLNTRAFPADPAAVPNDAPAHQVLGIWLTQDHDGLVEISRVADGTYQGRIVGGNDPDRLDDTNPDPALRREHLQGHLIMQGMHYLGAGHWSTGTIRDPNNGHVYKCRLQLLNPERLQVRGFLGISLLGRSQIWTRYTSKKMDLRPGH
jgi:uncharacterized protein (DUF2147 family)